MNEITHFKEVENRTPHERVKLALAQVQGPWDNESRDLLKKELTSQLHFDEMDDEMPVFVKIAFAGLTKAMTAFIGDGSQAHTLLGKSVVLNEEDRGLIALRAVVFDNRFAINPGWSETALLNTELSNGASLKEVYSRLEGKFKTFKIAAQVAMKAVKKVTPKELLASDGLDKDLEIIETPSWLPDSHEKLLQDKKKMEEKILLDMEEHVGRMGEYGLNEISSQLKTVSGDKIVDSSLRAARKIFAGVLESRANHLKSALDFVRE